MSLLYELKTYRYEEIEGDIWFPNLTFTGLLQIERSSGHIKNIYEIPGHNVMEGWRYSGAVRCMDKLVLIPNLSTQICIFDIKSKAFVCIEIEKKYLKENNAASMLAHARNNIVYVFPANMTCVIKVNVVDNTVEYLTYGIASIESKKSKDGIFFRQMYLQEDKKLYIPLATGEGIAVFDLLKEKFEYKKLPIKNAVTINKLKEKIYVGAWAEKKLYELNGETVQVIDKYPDDYKYEDYALAKATVVDSKLLLFPLRADSILMYEEVEGVLKKTEKVDRCKHPIFTYEIKSDEGIFADKNGIQKINCRDCVLEKKIVVDFDSKFNHKKIISYLKKIGNVVFLDNDCIMENNSIDVSFFIDWLTENEN